MWSCTALLESLTVQTKVKASSLALAMLLLANNKHSTALVDQMTMSGLRTLPLSLHEILDLFGLTS